MLEKWSEALGNAGVKLDREHRIMDFGDPEAECRAALDGNVISDLSHFGVIEVGGGDAEKFLQGQFTNDLRQVTPERGQLSAWCSAKGRVMVDFGLFRRGENYCLLLPADLVDSVLKRLRLYVLRAEVKLADLSDQLARMGLAGPEAPRLLREHLGLAPPEDAWGSSQADGETTVLRLPGPVPRFVLLARPETLMGHWAGLAAEARPAGMAAWGLLDVLAGLPWIDHALAEEYIPQMLNFPALGGVSFTKGCYTGQEVVARSQYLGSVKRRLYLAKTAAGECPPTNAEIRGSGDGEEAAGKVVNAWPHPDGGCRLLAVLRIAAAEAGGLSLTGSALDLLELPYQAALEKQA